MKHTDKFFVGYLPFPKGLKFFYVVLLSTVILFSTATAVFLASNQQAAGAGDWQVSNITSISGRLMTDPYPVLHTQDGESILIVVQGKQDAADSVMPFSNRMVTVTGINIARGDWQMLEIPKVGSIVLNKDAKPVSPPKTIDLGPETVVGEIVDSKCFLGVMKPGSGKVHRACASLCLLGGMPPMLVVKTDVGRYGYVLINSDGSSASKQLAGQVAIPVQVSGAFEKRGDLTYLRLTDDGPSTEFLTGDALSHYGESLAVEAVHPEFCGVMPDKVKS